MTSRKYKRSKKPKILIKRQRVIRFKMKTKEFFGRLPAILNIFGLFLTEIVNLQQKLFDNIHESWQSEFIYQIKSCIETGIDINT